MHKNLIEKQLQENEKKRGHLTRKLSNEEKEDVRRPGETDGESIELKPDLGSGGSQASDNDLTSQIVPPKPNKAVKKEKMVGVMVYFNQSDYEKFEELLHSGKIHSVKKCGLKFQQSELLALMTGNYHDLFVRNKEEIYDQIYKIVAQRK